MRDLELSASMSATDSRFKGLFWPTIRNRTDLDMVTAQGFWICLLVGVLTLQVSFLTRNPPVILAGCCEAAFYVLAGFGIRMHSRIAAAGAFLAYLLSVAVLQRHTGQGLSVVRVMFLALLLANVRGTWLAASWRPDESELPPLKLNETFRHGLVDQCPAWIWPRGRYVFYVMAVLVIGLLLWHLVPFPLAESGPAV
jgi:hypothetical protein